MVGTKYPNRGYTQSQKLNRRRFLKYAGASAAVVGASALGLDYLLSPQRTSTSLTASPSTSYSTSSLYATATSSQTFAYNGRLFFDRGTSTFGTAGNGIQDDPDSEPGEQNAKVLFLDANSIPVDTATTDSSGDFSIDLPMGNYTIYPVINNPDRTYEYMCQSVDEFRPISEGYDIVVGENNPKAYFGLLQGWLSFPKWSVRGDYGGYYDRDPRKWYILWWNGQGGHVDSIVSDRGEDNTSGTHFEAQFDEVISAFAPGIVESVRPDLPENWVVISHQIPGGEYYETQYAHNNEVLVQEGQKISRYQPIAKAGRRGVGIDINDAVVHLALIDVWNDNTGKKWVRGLDPYKAVFPITPLYDGCWAGPFHGSGQNWLPLTPDQNPNWKNRWIVENQTHF